MIINQKMTIEDVQTKTKLGWSSGALGTLAELKDKEIEIIDEYLEISSPEGEELSKYDDFLNYDTEIIANVLGFQSFEDIIERNRQNNFKNKLYEK